LLDLLAVEFVENGWSLKRMHKWIMTSTAYRQSSTIDRDKQAIDPTNDFYWRMPLRRLDAESLRDRILITSGKLDMALYGPSVPITEDPSGQVDVSGDAPRRSIYLQVRRSKPVSFLATFDAPVMELNCDRRVVSTGAPQSLMLMNSEFVLKQADTFAERVIKETPPLVSESAADRNQNLASAWEPRLKRAWELAYERPITAEELALSSQFIREQVAYMRNSHQKDPERGALADLCQQLLASNEFLHVD
jgi:hypothetical protein